MTENNQPDPQPTPAPSPADEVKRYAAYDKTYLRFVEGVHTSKKAAVDAAKKAGVKKFEIREV